MKKAKRTEPSIPVRVRFKQVLVIHQIDEEITVSADEWTSMVMDGVFSDRIIDLLTYDGEELDLDEAMIERLHREGADKARCFDIQLQKKRSDGSWGRVEGNGFWTEPKTPDDPWRFNKK